MPRQPSSNRRPTPTITQRFLRWLRGAISGTVRLFMPGARGVYPPHPDSLIVLGIALPADTDIDDISSRLWWRGLGVVERDRQVIVGADITAAVQKRHVRQARQFVIKQLRDAGVRRTVTRWEHPVLGNKGPGTGNRRQGTGDRKQGTGSEGQRAKQKTGASSSTTPRADKQAPKTKTRRSNPKSNI